MRERATVTVEDATSAFAAGRVASQLSASERRILAALSRRPQGLLGTASVAHASGVTESEAGPTLERLAGRGLVASEEETVRWCRPPRRETAWRLQIGRAWFKVAEQVRATALPELRPAPMPVRLPEQFRHLFWWGDPSAIELPRDAAFVAEQILACHDIGAWAWALKSLPEDALERVAAKAHTPPETKAMIRNALARRHETTV